MRLILINDNNAIIMVLVYINIAEFNSLSDVLYQ